MTFSSGDTSGLLFSLPPPSKLPKETTINHHRSRPAGGGGGCSGGSRPAGGAADAAASGEHVLSAGDAEAGQVEEVADHVTFDGDVQW